MNRLDPLPFSCGCCAGASRQAADAAVNGSRRRVIQIAAAGLAAPMVWTGGPALAFVPATAGDRLVEEDAEGTPTPLRLADLKPGKPLLAYPFDTKQGKARDGSRLNKVVLIRLPEAEMSADTRARAAGGVLAYSAICTHQACDVKTWVAKDKALVCFCHSSKFAALNGGAVTAGPAGRALPSLPLTLDGDVLVVAAGFSAAPGGSAK